METIKKEKKPFGYWNIKENCIKDAKNYQTRFEWRKGSPGAYNSALEHGWLDECCSHMIELRKPNGHWKIKQNCIDAALNYTSKKEFLQKCPGAYQSARKHGWLGECKFRLFDIEDGNYYKHKNDVFDIESDKYNFKEDFFKLYFE